MTYRDQLAERLTDALGMWHGCIYADPIHEACTSCREHAEVCADELAEDFRT